MDSLERTSNARHVQRHRRRELSSNGRPTDHVSSPSHHTGLAEHHRTLLLQSQW